MLHGATTRANRRYAKTSCAREFSAKREFNTTIVFFLGQEILTNVHKVATFFFSNLFLLQLLCRYLFMYENSHFYVPPLMYHIYLAEFLFLFLFLCFFCALCKERLCNFFFVNYFKEKLVLFVEKISRKGNVRKRTMREDEVSC